MKGGFLLFHDRLPLIEELTLVQRGKLLTACYLFSMSGENPNFSDDAVLHVVWKSVRAGLIYDQERYADRIEKRSTEGKLGGVIRALRAGQQISDQSVQFLRDHGCLSRDFLSNQHVKKSVIDNLLKHEE